MKITAMPEGFEICLEKGEKLEVVHEDEHTLKLKVMHIDVDSSTTESMEHNGVIYIEEA